MLNKIWPTIPDANPVAECLRKTEGMWDTHLLSFPVASSFTELVSTHSPHLESSALSPDSPAYTFPFHGEHHDPQEKPLLGPGPHQFGMSVLQEAKTKPKMQDPAAMGIWLCWQRKR